MLVLVKTLFPLITSSCPGSPQPSCQALPHLKQDATCLVKLASARPGTLLGRQLCEEALGLLVVTLLAHHLTKLTMSSLSMTTRHSYLTASSWNYNIILCNNKVIMGTLLLIYLCAVETDRRRVCIHKNWSERLPCAVAELSVHY